MRRSTTSTSSTRGRSSSTPQSQIEEGQELELKLVEVGLYDAEAGVGKLNGLDVAVAGAAKLVGKKVRVRVERVLDGTAFATLAGGAARPSPPITAEGLAEKPTRASRSRSRPARRRRKWKRRKRKRWRTEAEEEEEPAEEAEERLPAPPKKKRTRRGSRGGRSRKKPAGRAAAEDAAGDASRRGRDAGRAQPKIHLPAADLGHRGRGDGATGDADRGRGWMAPRPKKKKTRRGSRGGRRRRKPAGRQRGDGSAGSAGVEESSATISRPAGRRPHCLHDAFHLGMYAIISLQGKQYRVEEGQRLIVDRLSHADKPFHPPCCSSAVTARPSSRPRALR